MYLTIKKLICLLFKDGGDAESTSLSKIKKMEENDQINQNSKKIEKEESVSVLKTEEIKD